MLISLCTLAPNPENIRSGLLNKGLKDWCKESRWAKRRFCKGRHPQKRSMEVSVPKNRKSGRHIQRRYTWSSLGSYPIRILSYAQSSCKIGQWQQSALTGRNNWTGLIRDNMFLLTSWPFLHMVIILLQVCLLMGANNWPAGNASSSSEICTLL